MKYLKKYEYFPWNDKPLPEKTLEELVPESKLIEEFKKFGYSCDEKENRINSIDYDERDNDKLQVNFTSYAYAGEYSGNITNQLQQIADAIGADDFDFTYNWSVVFYFDYEKHPELEPKPFKEDEDED